MGITHKSCAWDRGDRRASMRMEVTEDEVRFDRLADEWDELLASSRQDGPFMSHARTRAWWHAYGNAAQLSIITLRDEGRLVGVLPAYIARQGNLVPVRALRFLGDMGVGGAGLSAFALPEAEREVVSLLVSHLASGSHDWDIADLRLMDAENAFFRGLADVRGTRIEPCADACPRIQLPDVWEHYLATLSKSRRQDFRRSERKLRERGLEIETISRAEDLPGAIEDFVRLQEVRLRQKFGAAFSLPAEYRAFAAMLLPALLARGRLRLTFLHQEGRRLAVLQGFRYGAVWYVERTGFDDSRVRNVMRPLWVHAVRAAFDEGCATFDLMNGVEAAQRYKLEWGVTHIRPLARLRLYAVSPPGLARRGRDSVVQWGRALHQHGKPA